MLIDRVKQIKPVNLWIPVVLVCVLVGSYLGLQQVTNPYLHISVAFSEVMRYQDQVTFFEEGAFSSQRYTPGRALWMVTVGKILGLDSQVNLQFLPIGSIILSIVYFAFFKKILGSYLLAALMTLHQMLNPSQLGGVYSVFAYGFGTALYLGFVLLFLRFQEKANIRDLLLIFAIVIATNAIHYAFTIWILITALLMTIWGWVARRWMNADRLAWTPVLTINLVLFIVVIFLTFNDVFYDSYLPYVGDVELLGGGWATFFNRLPWVGLGAGEADYEFGYQRNQLVSALSTTHLLFIILPVAAGMLYTLITFRRKSSIERDSNFYAAQAMVWVLVLTGVIDLVIYSLRGNIGLKFFVLIFPVATIWFLNQLGGRRLALFGASILLILSLTRLAVESSQGSIGVRPISYSQTDTFTSWYFENTADPNAHIYSDLNSYGKLLVKGSSYHLPGYYLPELRVIDPEIYDWILGKEIPGENVLAQLKKSSYIILDVYSDTPLRTPFWRELQPLAWHRQSVNTNSASVKLYDDGMIWIFQP
jgi:hypothetical protein